MIWEGNSSREFLDSVGLSHREVGDLGPVYGFQWRHFGAEYSDMHADYSGQGVDQLAEVIHKIKNKPDDRRIIMCAWNPKVQYRSKAYLDSNLIIVLAFSLQGSGYIFRTSHEWRCHLVTAWSSSTLRTVSSAVSFTKDLPTWDSESLSTLQGTICVILCG